MSAITCCHSQVVHITAETRHVYCVTHCYLEMAVWKVWTASMGSPRIPQLSTPSMYCDPALAGLKISSRKITDDAVSRGSVWAYPRRMRHTYMPVRATLIYRSAETPNYSPAAATPNDERGNALFDIMDAWIACYRYAAAALSTDNHNNSIHPPTPQHLW